MCARTRATLCQPLIFDQVDGLEKEREGDKGVKERIQFPP
jgi:hypothetical protein